jgi:hypothetical protein
VRDVFLPASARAAGAVAQLWPEPTCHPVGPITLGDNTYETDVALRFDGGRASYHVCVPCGAGWSRGIGAGS